MKEEQTHIWVKTPLDLRKLVINEILYCKTDDGRVTIFLHEKCPLVVTNPLSEIEKILPQGSFCRCHRSYIVNLDYVEKVCEKIPDAVLVNDMRIPVARDKKEFFLQKLLSV